MTLGLICDASIAGVALALIDLDDKKAEDPLWFAAHLELTGSAKAAASLLSHGLTKARSRVEDVRGCVVSVGPGSFTGIKVGLAFVAGLTAGRRTACPVLGLRSLLSAVAYEAQRDGRATAMFLPATRTHGFVAYSAAAKSGVRLITSDGDDLNQFLTEVRPSRNLVIGEWTTLEAGKWNGVEPERFPHQAAARCAIYGMANEARKVWPNGFSQSMPEPCYLRLSTAEEALQKSQPKR